MHLPDAVTMRKLFLVILGKQQMPKSQFTDL